MGQKKSLGFRPPLNCFIYIAYETFENKSFGGQSLPNIYRIIGSDLLDLKYKSNLKKKHSATKKARASAPINKPYSALDYWAFGRRFLIYFSSYEEKTMKEAIP